MSDWKTQGGPRWIAVIQCFCLVSIPFFFFTSLFYKMTAILAFLALSVFGSVEIWDIFFCYYRHNGYYDSYFYNPSKWVQITGKKQFLQMWFSILANLCSYVFPGIYLIWQWVRHLGIF